MSAVRPPGCSRRRPPAPLTCALPLMSWTGRSPADRIVVTDSGRFSRAPWRHLRVNDPRDFVYTTSFGFIGLGISTAIGAAVGRPDRVTVGVVGDGGGMMGLIELSTAVRSAIPVLIVVMNDRSYGSEYSKLFAFGLDPHYPLRLAGSRRGCSGTRSSWQVRTIV